MDNHKLKFRSNKSLVKLDRDLSQTATLRLLIVINTLQINVFTLSKMTAYILWKHTTQRNEVLQMGL